MFYCKKNYMHFFWPVLSVRLNTMNKSPISYYGPMCYGHSRFFVFLAPRPYFPIPVLGTFVVRLSSNQHDHSRLGRIWFALIDACNQLTERRVVQKGVKNCCIWSHSELIICTPSLLAEDNRTRCFDVQPKIL